MIRKIRNKISQVVGANNLADNLFIVNNELQFVNLFY